METSRESVVSKDMKPEERTVIRKEDNDGLGRNVTVIYIYLYI